MKHNIYTKKINSAAPTDDDTLENTGELLFVRGGQAPPPKKNQELQKLKKNKTKLTFKND